MENNDVAIGNYDIAGNRVIDAGDINIVVTKDSINDNNDTTVGSFSSVNTTIAKAFKGTNKDVEPRDR